MRQRSCSKASKPPNWRISSRPPRPAFLADQGATVIKVESGPRHPCTAPSEGRPLDWHENTSRGSWRTRTSSTSPSTRNRRRGAIFALLEDADVLITNWRQGPSERQGPTTSPKALPQARLRVICTGYAEGTGQGPARIRLSLPSFARGGYPGDASSKERPPKNVVPGTATTTSE